MKGQDFKDQVIELAGDRPFDKEVLGMKVDETRKFTISIPDNDANAAMAGKPVAYEATLKDLRKREVPELNDEFAKDLGSYETLADLQAFVRKDLEEAAERDAVSRAQSTLLDTLLERTPFEVPASMTDLQLDDFCQEFANMVARQGMDPKKINWSAYRQSRMRDAEKAVRSGYLLQAIGNAEDIQVSDEEMDADIRKFMEEHKVQQPFQTVKDDLEKRGALNEFKGRIRTDKIFEHLFSIRHGHRAGPGQGRLRRPARAGAQARGRHPHRTLRRGWRGRRRLRGPGRWRTRRRDVRRTPCPRSGLRPWA